eukprot:SAG22_NODE_129_length_18679_cov_40.656028_5_plen_113_part_00
MPCPLTGVCPGLAIVLGMDGAPQDYKKLYKDISTVSARFSNWHTRVKSCAESIAFFAGDDREYAIVDARFQEVMALERTRNWLTFKFRVIEECVIFRAVEPQGKAEKQKERQ